MVVTLQPFFDTIHSIFIEKTTKNTSNLAHISGNPFYRATSSVGS